MDDPRFDGLRSYTDAAVRQPEFAAIQGRARRVRRRRTVAVSAAAAAVLVIAGLGIAAVAAPGTPPPPIAASHGPTVSAWPQLTGVVATTATDLYAVRQSCAECGPELFRSGDVGQTWQKRTLPQPAKAGALYALGKTVLAWRERSAPERGGTLPEGLWTSVDGARSWQRAKVAPTPAVTLPAGTRPVDCTLVSRPDDCEVWTVDPGTGVFRPLGAMPVAFRTRAGDLTRADVPLSAATWIPGIDPATRKPVLALSPDQGEHWLLRSFDGQAGQAPEVAIGATGEYVYALTHRTDGTLTAHRSADVGVDWSTGAKTVAVSGPGFVTADGAHVLRSGSGFLTSRDGGDYRPVTLTGYPAELAALGAEPAQPVAGRFLAYAKDLIAVSDDGWTWRRVQPPS